MLAIIDRTIFEIWNSFFDNLNKFWNFFENELFRALIQK